MGLRLHNTLTRTKEDFVPIDPTSIRMYVCGPTVYDFAHIGNARPLIVFDVLFRLLRHLYGAEHVTYVRNITDVDDKINARAAEEYPGLPLNEAIREITTRTEKQFHEDVAALGCLKPTHEPRATEYISRPDAPEDMIRLVRKLIEKGNAYPAEGHVLFDVKSWKAADGSPEYGKLSNRSLDDMIAGARVEIAPYKKDPMDFVLWKPSKPGEPAWESPWGRGRPGWHLECSAMAGALLGDTFDIHGGGIDLVFPHHENEIAQSRCAHGTPVMANYWLHNGFLQVEGEKMSKSLGNFVTIRDLLETTQFGSQRWHGRVLRLAMLMTHYRQPIDWTVDRLVDARNQLYDWNKLCYDAPRLVDPPNEVLDPLADDLNSPAAIAGLHALTTQFEKSTDGRDTVAIASKIRAGLEVLGLYEEAPSVQLLRQDVRDRVFEEKADTLVAARFAARTAKNFAEADRIRAELEAMGIQLMDAKDPETGELVTTWEVKR
jgi:cysteinyl-tRNA synthetase